MAGYLNKERDIKGDFTKAPNALWKFYTKLPDFIGDHAILYLILLDRYNDSLGYAFPGQDELELKTGYSQGKLKRLRGVLVRYDLVEEQRKGNGSNIRYYLKLPILDEVEFERKFDHLLNDYYEKAEKVADRSEKAKARRDKLQENEVVET